MDQTTLFFTVSGGIILILGFLGGVVGFLMKLGAEIAIHRTTLETACQDVEQAHSKIRDIAPVIATHTTDIAVLKNDIGYIREAVDDVRRMLRAKA